jgi:signal transduction histidine kinase
MAMAVKGNRAIHGVEGMLEQPNGARVHFVAYPMPLRDAAGIPVGAVNVLVDITERKRAETALRAKQEQLAAMAVDLSLAEERERRRIAAELHDQIGQTLLLGKLKLGMLVDALPAGTNEVIFGEVLELLDQAVRDTRSLTQQLDPPILAGVGLEAALEWLGRRLEADYKLRVDFFDDRMAKPLSEELRCVVYQSARELLINVAKHARVNEARLAIGREGELFSLTVEDHGIGFDCFALNQGTQESGFGLFNIQQRIKLLGGSLSFKSQPGQGAKITLRVPLAGTAVEELFADELKNMQPQVSVPESI